METVSPFHFMSSFPFFAVILLLAALMLVSAWKVYEKAGQPGWASIIPIYCTIVFLNIAKKPLYWFFLMLIPFFGIIWVVLATNAFAKAFGKSEGFTIGLIFLPFVFYPILAFDDSQYILAEQDFKY